MFLLTHLFTALACWILQCSCLKIHVGIVEFFTRLTKDFSRELLSFSCPANNSIDDLAKKRPTCLHTYIHTNQTRIKCWSAGATLRAEQWPCEPSKGFVSKSGERERARESQTESERVKESQRESVIVRESQGESERISVALSDSLWHSLSGALSGSLALSISLSVL